MMKNFVDRFDKLLSDKSRRKFEDYTIYVSIVGFLVHLILIGLVHFKIILGGNQSHLLNSPIAAIYTPFSFIIFYEVYLLVYYLPKSTTIYIGKQYEIITLIVIRRAFKNLSNLEFNQEWIKTKSDIQFSFDLLATIVLFYLIYIFYKLNDEQEKHLVTDNLISSEIVNFISIKKLVAALLIPIFLVMSVYSFGSWISENFLSISALLDNMKNVNKIFFDDFFTVLILVDVLLLLFSFLHTDQFYKIIKNSGFIISTTLIKLSFNTEGLLNLVLILVAVLFGIAVLFIHNKYERTASLKNM
jgi:hypothetical protein